MDNINIFRGNKQHHKPFKNNGENMWKFTVRGLLPHYIDNFVKENTIESQRDVKKLTLNNIELENNPEHLYIWNAHFDCYLSTFLDDGLPQWNAHFDCYLSTFLENGLTLNTEVSY
jgi:hypothetical protein